MKETFLDHDFLRTPEDFLFCVVGCIHPRDRVIAYLKYMPSHRGKWGQKDRHYRRTMQAYTIPSLLSNIKMLKSEFPQYVFNSRVMGIQMSAVPRRCIVHHHRPSEKLVELLTSSKKDGLEQITVSLIHELSKASGVKIEDFGVTGSILTRIHRPEFSDIDLVVYGYENAKQVKDTMLTSLSNQDSPMQPLKGPRLRRSLRHWTERYHLSRPEAEWFSGRKWNYGIFEQHLFSIHPVKPPREVQGKYGDRTYQPQGIVEGAAKIVNITESFFLPCEYRIQNVQPTSSLEKVESLVSYNGFFSGIFQVDDVVKFRGKLEAVYSRSGESSCRVLIGSPEARGFDYIKPSLS